MIYQIGYLPCILVVLTLLYTTSKDISRPKANFYSDIGAIYLFYYFIFNCPSKIRQFKHDNTSSIRWKKNLAPTVARISLGYDYIT